jgi:hypothetical protein
MEFVDTVFILAGAGPGAARTWAYAYLMALSDTA